MLVVECGFDGEFSTCVNCKYLHECDLILPSNKELEIVCGDINYYLLMREDTSKAKDFMFNQLHSKNHSSVLGKKNKILKDLQDKMMISKPVIDEGNVLFILVYVPEHEYLLFKMRNEDFTYYSMPPLYTPKDLLKDTTSCEDYNCLSDIVGNMEVLNKLILNLVTYQTIPFTSLQDPTLIKVLSKYNLIEESDYDLELQDNIIDCKEKIKEINNELRKLQTKKFNIDKELRKEVILELRRKAAEERVVKEKHVSRKPKFKIKRPKI